MATRLRNAIRRILEPEMAEAGFTIRYPHFQRRRGGRLELVSVQHDKWGGGFCLEFAPHPAGDLATDWGEVVPEDRIDVAYTDPGTRARLLASTAAADSYEGFFRYEDFADDKDRCEALVAEVVALLPQVFAWFDDGTVGPNVSPFAGMP